MIRHFFLVSNLHRLPLASLYWRAQIYFRFAKLKISPEVGIYAKNGCIFFPKYPHHVVYGGHNPQVVYYSITETGLLTKLHGACKEK